MDIKELKDIFNSCDIEDRKIVITSKLTEFLKLLKEEYSYNLLTEIIAIDNQTEIELLYKLFSQENDESVTVSISVAEECETVTDIFPSAIADENEIYDLFGIKFIGNKNLKRLYMPESWQGHPLRKNYIENDERLGWNDKN